MGELHIYPPGRGLSPAAASSEGTNGDTRRPLECHRAYASTGSSMHVVHRRRMLERPSWPAVTLLHYLVRCLTLHRGAKHRRSRAGHGSDIGHGFWPRATSCCAWTQLRGSAGSLRNDQTGQIGKSPCFHHCTRAPAVAPTDKQQYILPDGSIARKFWA